jgi:hypothetical protein
MTFELNSLALTEETVVQLEHPATGELLFAPVEKGEDPESKPVQVTVKGEASREYQKAVDAMMKKINKRGKREATPDELREQNADFLTALSVRVDNMTLNGEPVDNPEAFRKLYLDPHYDWVKVQVNKAVQSVEHFLKR